MSQSDYLTCIYLSKEDKGEASHCNSISVLDAL